MIPIRIGTRGSKLALWQANFVADRLRPFAVPRSVSLVEIETSGDRVQDRPLGVIGGQGVFTKEIQRALLDLKVDVAVHSLKDLPTVPTAGLVLAAVPSRGPREDVLVCQRYGSFAELPHQACVATSSPRRKAQLLHRRPDLRIADIRGNVETRVRKLSEQGLDALVLARAGLERLGLSHAVTEVLGWMLPAVGQGALGLECRSEDQSTLALLRSLNDATTHQAVLAERAFLRRLGGGCQVPIGVFASISGGELSLRGVVLDPKGTRRIDGELQGKAENAEEIGQRLAAHVLDLGAQELLACTS